MPRPSAAQFCLGSFTVVATTVALLAVSGASGVLEVAVLVAFALALGTVVTVLSLSLSSRPADRAKGPGSRAATGREYARQR
ncbi:hypothetical protein ACH4E7_19200 [Kitasatospora sp. NPDC018058]|uniref:hypothetical protein n=1 Tax=Kitasatospora sp. NPDC018058 TaxID=3364025 RepID=UPI0037BF6A4B